MPNAGPGILLGMRVSRLTGSSPGGSSCSSSNASSPAMASVAGGGNVDSAAATMSSSGGGGNVVEQVVALGRVMIVVLSIYAVPPVFPQEHNKDHIIVSRRMCSFQYSTRV